jgi:hypothetical protein
VGLLLRFDEAVVRIRWFTEPGVLGSVPGQGPGGVATWEATGAGRMDT